MKSKNEVSLNEALLALKYAISNAWADTRRQVKASSYDPRIVQTAFGQFLVHNVMNRIYQLNEDYQSMTAELRPNSSNTAYHVAIRLEDTLLTVSAIPHENLRPRAALFREDYASRQGFFEINGQNRFVAASPPELSESTKTYLQILHGPKADDRQQLGFMLVASLNRFNEYEGKPVPLDELLLNFPTQQDDVEEIQDGISIGIRDGVIFNRNKS